MQKKKKLKHQRRVSQAVGYRGPFFSEKGLLHPQTPLYGVSVARKVRGRVTKL